MKHQEEQERDELRARFTRWMEVTLYRARINYLSRQAREQERFFLVEEIPEKYLPEEEPEREWFRELLADEPFWFTRKSLERAFRSLRSSKQSILTMLFVEERTPGEIAAKLGCSKQNVYKQRALALKELKDMLQRGGDSHEQ